MSLIAILRIMAWTAVVLVYAVRILFYVAKIFFYALRILTPLAAWDIHAMT